jgi:hypothetical protein
MNESFLLPTFSLAHKRGGNINRGYTSKILFCPHRILGRIHSDPSNLFSPHLIVRYTLVPVSILPPSDVQGYCFPHLPESLYNPGTESLDLCMRVTMAVLDDI